MKIFPTRQQFSNWSLPSKASYIGLWVAIILFILSYFPSGRQKTINQHAKGERPYLRVEIVSPKLWLDKEGKSWLPYILINNGGMTAYNIRKGHRIFNEKKECIKHYYDTTNQYLLDLVPGEKSPIHTDNLEKLVIEGNGLDEKFFKLQLIITYTKSKDENDTLYYSLVNLVLKPINCKEGYCNEFIISRPSTRIGSMDKFIDECKEFNNK